MGLEDTLGSKLCTLLVSVDLPNTVEKEVKTLYTLTYAIPARPEYDGMCVCASVTCPFNEYPKLMDGGVQVRDIPAEERFQICRLAFLAWQSSEPLQMPPRDGQARPDHRQDGGTDSC